MLKEKREQFRIQIRRQKNEEIFTKKRSQLKITQQIMDFPYDSLNSLKQNIPQSLDALDAFLTSKQEMDSQSIDKLIQAGQFAFEIMPMFLTESSRFLTNLTFHMKRDQLICLLRNCPYINLLNLLNHKSDDLKDNFSKIIINILVDLEQTEFNQFAESMMLLNNIYHSYITHGANRELSFTYLRILASLFCANYKEPQMEQVLEMIDNICQAASDDQLKVQSFKTMRAAIASQFIKQLEIVEQVDKFLIIDDCLSAIQSMIEAKKKTDLGIQALKLLNVMLEKNKQIMKLLLENYKLLIHYSSVLQDDCIFELQHALELVYRGLCYIIEDDNLFAIQDQDHIFEVLVKHVQIANKDQCSFPPSISRLIFTLLRSRYREQTIIEFPIFKIVNEHYQTQHFPLTIEEYLQIALTTLQIGETIYPERYVGEFLKHQGELVIQDIQKNTSDYNNMQIVEQILKMAEYDENEF